MAGGQARGQLCFAPSFSSPSPSTNACSRFGLCPCLSFPKSLLLISSSSFSTVRFPSTQRARVVANGGLVLYSFSLIYSTPIAFSHSKTHHTMLAYVGLAVLIAGSALVRADPVPTAPGPGDVFKVGGQCSFTWTADTTGTWKEMNVELMSGSNFQMNHITSKSLLSRMLNDGLNARRSRCDPRRHRCVHDEFHL